MKPRGRSHDSNWHWVKLGREAGRKLLLFLIGEPPIRPLDPAAAAAITTAPP
jgi:hypothetical protein